MKVLEIQYWEIWQAVLEEVGIMGDIEWVIVGGIISRMLCITWGEGGKGVVGYTRRSVNSPSQPECLITFMAHMQFSSNYTNPKSHKNTTQRLKLLSHGSFTLL